MAAADTPSVLQLIDRRRDELLVEARELGRRVHAERPGEFARRLKRYLSTALGEQNRVQAT